jgi:acyl-CoA thioester hydrolase
MRNAASGEISAICVLTGVQIDSQTRKSCPFPPELAERARGLVRSYELPD